jgi:hypothetical protein
VQQSTEKFDDLIGILNHNLPISEIESYQNIPYIKTVSGKIAHLTWNIIKSESGKLHLTEQIPSVLINSEKVNDPQIIADAFNTFFFFFANY